LKSDLGQKRRRQLTSEDPQQQLVGDMDVVHTPPHSSRTRLFTRSGILP
jgi:hypothetical protein